MSTGEFKYRYTPAEILQDSANFLASAKDKLPHMKPIIEDYATAVNEIVSGEVVDLSVQFRDNERTSEPERVGTVQFDGWIEDSKTGKWVAKMRSINAGGFNEWPKEGIEIPLGADCLIISDISPAE